MNLYLIKQFLIAGCLYIGQIVSGYTTGWSAPMVLKLLDPEQNPFEDVITEAQATSVGSTVAIGLFLGPYISGYLSNAIGRKPSLLLGGSTCLLGLLIVSLARQLAVLYVGRFIIGLGKGTMIVTNLVYIGEMASTNIRGVLLTLTGFCTSLGTLLVYSVAPFVSYAVVNWLAVGILACYVFGVYFVVPESPMYLISTGKYKEATDILQLLGRENDVDNLLATADEKPESNLTQLIEMFTVKINRKATFLILVLNILQQFSGVVAVLFFATTIFEQTGSNLEPHISTIIIGVTQVVAGTAAPLFVDRTGRRSLLLVSTMICTLSLTTLGTYFYLYSNGHPAAESLSWLSLLSLIVFFVGYNMGFGIIPNTFTGEMFTANVRSFGSTFTMTIGWLFGFGVTSAFGYMWPAWGAAVTIWIYAGACAVAVLFTIVFVPETKGKTLLEIQEMLSK